MRIDAVRQEGYQLLHEGLRELSMIEANGIRIDVPRLRKTKRKLVGRIKRLREELQEDEVWEQWRKRYGFKSNLGSRAQFATILFDQMGFVPANTTDGGRAKMNEESLQDVDHPFVRKWLRMQKYDKTLGTFLKGIESEIVGDRLHPAFNLHIARSYRSSSDSPNFQNFPVRDNEIARIIRSLFIASNDHALSENDFQGIEVSMSACYHKDPNFISYITTPGKDMHRDMAAQLYCLKPEQVSKDARYGAKNKFVFPQFYGDYYISCTRSLWEWMEKGKLLGPDGDELGKHLARHGIMKRGECDPSKKPEHDSFEKHVKEVEDDFWNNRFRRYGEWRKRWYAQYVERGYFDMKTGFRVHGTVDRKQCTNYPIQGSAFHCLLWTLIQVNRKLRKYKMKSMLVGQIHDSLIGDISIDELRDYLEIVEGVVSDDLRKHYPWINVPMMIKYELALPGSSWHDKQEILFDGGEFIHPNKPERRTGDVHKFLSALR